MVKKFVPFIFLISLVHLVSCGGQRSPSAESSRLASVSIGKYEGSQSWDVMRIRVTDVATNKSAFSADIKFKDFDSKGNAENATAQLPYPASYKVKIKYYRTNPNQKERAAETIVYQNCESDSDLKIEESKATFEFSVCDGTGKQIGQAEVKPEGKADVVFKPKGEPSKVDPQQTEPPQLDSQDPLVKSAHEALKKLQQQLTDDSKHMVLQEMVTSAFEDLKKYATTKVYNDRLVFCGGAISIQTHILELGAEDKLTTTEKDALSSPLLVLFEKGKICD